jgi:general secretion pathway protein H
MGGFTLIELLIVVAIIAVASAVVSLSLRDPQATRLEREAQRLAILLDAGRAQARALGLEVRWRLVTDPRERIDSQGRRVDFRFDGLPAQTDLPSQWLGAPEDGVVQVELPPRQDTLLLGPEPLIPAQRLSLRLGAQQLLLVTDGLGPFTVQAP